MESEHPPDDSPYAFPDGIASPWALSYTVATNLVQKLLQVYFRTDFLYIQSSASLLQMIDGLSQSRELQACAVVQRDGLNPTTQRQSTLTGRNEETYTFK